MSSRKGRGKAPKPSPSPDREGLQFINYQHPEDAKNTDNMRAVRRQAMNATLQRTGTSQGDRQRLTQAEKSIINRSLDTPLPTRGERRHGSYTEDEDTDRSLTHTPLEEAISTPSSSLSMFQRTPSQFTHGTPPDMDRESYSPLVQREQSGTSSFASQMQLWEANLKLFFGSQAFEDRWMKFGAQDWLFNRSALCIAARHTDALHRRTNNPATNELYGEVIQGLNERRHGYTERTNTFLIATLVHLSFSEAYTPERNTSAKDLLQQLAWISGDVRTLDFSFPGLSRTVTIALLLFSAIRELPPSQQVLEAATNEFRLDRASVNALESPLCHSNMGYIQLQAGRGYPSALIDLLEAARHLVDIVVQDGLDPKLRRQRYDEQSRMIRLRASDFNRPDVIRASRGQGQSFSHVWSACRLAYVILESALFNHRYTLSAAVRNKDLLERLRDALQCTDLMSCWGDLSGVLLWVSLVGATAANSIDPNDNDAVNLRAFMVGCVVRTIVINTFLHPGETILALTQFLRVQEVCNVAQPPR